MVQYLSQSYKANFLKNFVKDIEIVGDEERTFNNVSNLDNIRENSLIYIEEQRYFNDAIKSKCSIIILSPQIYNDLINSVKDFSNKDSLLNYLNNNFKSLVIFKNPKALWAYATSLFKKRIVNKGKIGKNCLIKSPINISEIEIADNVIIEKNVNIGKNVFIGHNSYIGENVIIGDNTYIYPQVTILENCLIGSNCIIHSGTVIGSDGFGYQFYDFNHIKIEQIGKVKIGNFVEIGANCTIDRGTVEDTIISDFCKIDNLVQIAHNVFIDKGTIIASQTGIAGGAKIGKFVFIGGQVGVADHAIIEDGVKIAAKTGISKTTYEKGKMYAGSPAVEAHLFRRISASLKYLPDIVKKLDFWKNYLNINAYYYKKILIFLGNMMNRISKNVYVDQSSLLGENNIIEEGVIIKENCKIGNNNYFQSGSIIGPNVIIGDNNFFGHYCFIGGDPQDVAFQGGVSYVKIGNNNKIREFVTIHRGTKEGTETVVGDNNFLMAYSHMGHNAKIGNSCVLVNNAQMAGYSELGNFVVMSAFCAIHQFCKVGDYVMIGGDTKVNKDIPPFVMIFGVPAKVIGLNIVGLRRNGFSQERRLLIKEIYKVLYHSKLPFSKAIEIIKEKYGNEPEAINLINFYYSSKRGLVGFKGEEKDVEG